MAMMTIPANKRACSFEEELLLLDPHNLKRGRLGLEDDVTLPAAVEEALATAVAAATSSSDSAAASAPSSSTEVPSCSRRRHHDEMDDDLESDGTSPLDKRRRQHSQTSLEIQSWAETVVKDLKGCPSVEEAIRRCSRVLNDFVSEVRQAAFREAEATCSAPDAKAPTVPPATNDASRPQEIKVLRRAVFHLAERCRRLAASSQESETLRQALEQSEEARRRLAHSNEVLQGHLRVHLDGCRDQPWLN